MNNVMKTQWYQMSRNVVSYVLLLALFLVPILNFTVLHGRDFSDPGTEMLLENNAGFGMIFLVLVVASVFCRDIKDRTIYQEITAGISMKESFLGRLVISLVVGVIGCLLSAFSIMIISSFVNGWGDRMTVDAFVVRLLVALLFLIRVSSEVVLLATLCENTAITVVVSLVVGFAESIFIAMSMDKNLYFLAGNCMFGILSPLSKMVFDADGEISAEIASSLSMDIVIGSVVSSVIITALCLVIALKIFEKREY